MMRNINIELIHDVNYILRTVTCFNRKKLEIIFPQFRPHHKQHKTRIVTNIRSKELGLEHRSRTARKARIAFLATQCKDGINSLERYIAA